MALNTLGSSVFSTIKGAGSPPKLNAASLIKQAAVAPRPAPMMSMPMTSLPFANNGDISGRAFNIPNLMPSPRLPGGSPLMNPRPAPQIGTPWNRTIPPPMTTPGMPHTTPPPPMTTTPHPGGGGTCAGGGGTCGGVHTPGTPNPMTGNPGIQTPNPGTSGRLPENAPQPTLGVAPQQGTPIPLSGQLDMSQLAGVMAAMVPASQSQSIYLGGQQQGQNLPFQAEHAFRGRDPALQNGGGGNILDMLRQGFWS